MGLDQHLNKKTYVQRWEHISSEKQFSVTVKRGGKAFAPIKSKRISYITERVGYWRKANQIHSWFVQNVQDGKDDCGYYYVSTEKLTALLDTVKEVLADHSKARELLPASVGFFFGSTDYDTYYYQDLQYTEKLLTDILSEQNDHAGFEYHSSW